MKNHDFGQFIFNSKLLNEKQIQEVIKIAKMSQPSLAISALFLQLINEDELAQDEDEVIKTLLTEEQINKIKEFNAGQSATFAQALFNYGVVNLSELNKLIKKYNELEIQPIESALTTYYDCFKDHPSVDFPFALNLFERFHTFLSEAFNSSVVILPPCKIKNEVKIGASVKIDGKIPIIVSILADEEMFITLAKIYDSYVEEPEDAHDAISELLNVFTGHFAVQIALMTGLEELPEPPRCGTISEDVYCITMMSEVGKFYIYIGREEIFEKNS